MCIVCFVFVYPVPSVTCCAESVPNSFDGRQQSRKAVGGTAPDDKHAYPCLCDIADVAHHRYQTAKHIVKEQSTTLARPNLDSRAVSPSTRTK